MTFMSDSNSTRRLPKVSTIDMDLALPKKSTVYYETTNNPLSDGPSGLTAEDHLSIRPSGALIHIITVRTPWNRSPRNV